MSGEPKSLYEEVLQFREGAAVKRWHIQRSVREQTVGYHSHGVAMLCAQLMPGCSAALLKAALMHDLHEGTNGDLPSPAKWNYPPLAVAADAAEARWNDMHGVSDNYAQLDSVERRLLHFCDYAELLMWSMEEVCMGNRYYRVCIERMLPALQTLCTPTAPTGFAGEFFSDIQLAATQLLKATA